MAKYRGFTGLMLQMIAMCVLFMLMLSGMVAKAVNTIMKIN
jgi:hypothetical protein